MTGFCNAALLFSLYLKGTDSTRGEVGSREKSQRDGEAGLYKYGTGIGKW